MTVQSQDVFPFFVGAERSDTTLLRAMFHCRPEMAVPPESWVVADVARPGDRSATRFDQSARADGTPPDALPMCCSPTGQQPTNPVFPLHGTGGGSQPPPISAVHLVVGPEA